MTVLGLVLDFMVAAGTIALALAAYLEISEAARARRLEAFDRDLERVLGLDGGEFWVALRNLLRRWREDPRLGPESRRMRSEYAMQRGIFLKRLAELRPEMVETCEVMLRDHPEVRDGGPLLGDRYSAGADGAMWGMRRFRELAAGEVGHWPYETAYNSPQPFRVAETEEPAPEILMMEILRSREEALHGEEVRNARLTRSCSRDAYDDLRRRCSETIDAFVYWKSTGPEGALHDLLLTAQGLESPEASAWSIWEGDNIDLARIAEKLAWMGVYRVMRDPTSGTGLDGTAQKMADEQIAAHRLLLARAAEGLRPALEREPRVLRAVRRIGEGLRRGP